MIILELKLNELSPDDIWKRTQRSLYKICKGLCDEKKTDLHSLETDGIFSAWGKPEDVQSDSYL